MVWSRTIKSNKQLFNNFFLLFLNGDHHSFPFVFLFLGFTFKNIFHLSQGHNYLNLRSKNKLKLNLTTISIFRMTWRGLTWRCCDTEVLNYCVRKISIEGLQFNSINLKIIFNILNALRAARVRFSKKYYLN